MFEMRFAPWLGPDHEEVREAVHVDAVQAAHAVGPVLRQRQVVAADHLEARSAGRSSVPTSNPEAKMRQSRS